MIEKAILELLKEGSEYEQVKAIKLLCDERINDKQLQDDISSLENVVVHAREIEEEAGSLSCRLDSFHEQYHRTDEDLVDQLVDKVREQSVWADRCAEEIDRAIGEHEEEIEERLNEIDPSRKEEDED